MNGYIFDMIIPLLNSKKFLSAGAAKRSILFNEFAEDGIMEQLSPISFIVNYAKALRFRKNKLCKMVSKMSTTSAKKKKPH